MLRAALARPIEDVAALFGSGFMANETLLAPQDLTPKRFFIYLEPDDPFVVCRQTSQGGLEPYQMFRLLYVKEHGPNVYWAMEDSKGTQYRSSAGRTIDLIGNPHVAARLRMPILRRQGRQGTAYSFKMTIPRDSFTHWLSYLRAVKPDTYEKALTLIP